jgi:tetratricopeptide (TPR) repeat protein
MNYDKLDNDELLYVALDAVNGARYGDAILLIRTLLERDPKNVKAQYLLAAQHAQIGMYERAETGFRDLLSDTPDFPIARFQLGQLLLMKNTPVDAKGVLSPLTDANDAIGAYARALCAVADEDAVSAVRELEVGLRLPQPVPTLANDMQALLMRLSQSGDRLVERMDAMPPELGDVPEPELQSTPTARMFMTGYGRGG